MWRPQKGPQGQCRQSHEMTKSTREAKMVIQNVHIKVGQMFGQTCETLFTVKTVYINTNKNHNKICLAQILQCGQHREIRQPLWAKKKKKELANGKTTVQSDDISLLCLQVNNSVFESRFLGDEAQVVTVERLGGTRQYVTRIARLATETTFSAQ